MGNLGGGEILVILLIALVVLGPSRLPEAARQVGRAANELRRMSGAFQRELRQAIQEPVNETKALINDAGSTDKAASSSTPSALKTPATNSAAPKTPATNSAAPKTPAPKTPATKTPATKSAAPETPAKNKTPATTKPATTKPATAEPPESPDGPHPPAETESSGDPEASEG